jgi:hypothetical protein
MTAKTGTGNSNGNSKDGLYVDTVERVGDISACAIALHDPTHASYSQALGDTLDIRTGRCCTLSGV